MVHSPPRPQSPPSPSSAIPWRAQTGPQLLAIQRHDIEELFYGGAVGGGKTDYLLGDFGQDVYEPWGPYWHGILFRRSYPELEDLIARSQEVYPSWFPGCRWAGSEQKTWYWPSGATLKMRYLESSTDWMRYWGHAYTWIGWDELPTWPNMDAYIKLKARLRSAHHVPNKRIRATGNPGGPGHSHVKLYFGIDRYPLGGEVFGAGGMRRLFVRSRLADNRILLQADPGYANRLAGLGSPDLVRAWLEGDWSVIAGAFFPEFSDRHIIEPQTLPAHWTHFRAVDWGSAKPFSVGWYAVASEDFHLIQSGSTATGGPADGDLYVRKYREAWTKELPSLPSRIHEALAQDSPAVYSAAEKRQLQELCERLFEARQDTQTIMQSLWGIGFSDASSRLQQAAQRCVAVSQMPSRFASSRIVPRGALIKYREWYGMPDGQPNTGLKLTAEEVGHGIITCGPESCLYTVLDPSAFAEDGGPSIAERMAKAGVVCSRADNTRVSQRGSMGGWDQLRARLKGEDGRPMIYFFSTCAHTIRTLPALQHDTTKPEDVDTDAEDHAADETRYACMSRPWAMPMRAKAEPPRGARTIQEMVDRHESRDDAFERL